MLKTRTVLVLGAGASSPYGYPIGSSLVGHIQSRESTVGSGPLHSFGFDHERYRELQEVLRFGAFNSIDAMLGLPQYAHLKDVGRLAIAYELVFGQTERNLWTEPGRWHSFLVQRMCEGCRTLEEFAENKLSVVTFNYDLSLEHAMFLAISQRFKSNTPTEVADALLRAMPVIHVHGHLGHLPWMGLNPSRTRAYGGCCSAEDLRRAAEGIIIISEAVETTAEFNAARALIEDSEQIFILGFGFHPENVARLQIPLVGAANFKPERYISAMSLVNSTREQNRIASLFQGCDRIFFRNGDGNLLFGESNRFWSDDFAAGR